MCIDVLYMVCPKAYIFDLTIYTYRPYRIEIKGVGKPPAR